MIITRDKIRKIRETKVLTENIKSYFKDIIPVEDIEKELDTNINARQVIVETIIEDITPGAYELIYIEVPWQDTVSRQEIITKYGNEVFDFLMDMAKYIVNKTSAAGATIINVSDEIHLELGDKGLPDNLILIMLNHKMFDQIATLNLYESKLWTLVHEVFHNYPAPDKDEESVQRKTFDWLLKYGYTNSILAELTQQLITASLDYIDKDSEYIILNYIFDTLNQKDKGLLFSYLTALKEMFTDDNIKETISHPRAQALILWKLNELQEKYLK